MWTKGLDQEEPSTASFGSFLPQPRAHVTQNSNCGTLLELFRTLRAVTYLTYVPADSPGLIRKYVLLLPQLSLQVGLSRHYSRH